MLLVRVFGQTSSRDNRAFQWRLTFNLLTLQPVDLWSANTLTFGVSIARIVLKVFKIANTTTCVEANATGVYGGVINSENGNGPADPSNLRKTFLRGIQQTDNDGVVKFSTVFPGHYAGRTIHIHVMLHPNAKPYPNGTIIDTTAAYVGQMYFNQNLINSVERHPPYSQNNNPLTPNSQDFILQQDLQQGGNPFVQYKMLGSRLEDGILAWLTYGINPSRRSHVTPVATRKGLQPRGTAKPDQNEI